MLKVICGDNFSRHQFAIAGNTIIAPDGTQTTMPSAVTLRNVLDAAGVDYTRGMTNIDGATLQAGDINKTFAEMGYTDGKCFLTNVAKTDNA